MNFIAKKNNINKKIRIKIIKIIFEFGDSTDPSNKNEKKNVLKIKNDKFFF